MIKRFPSVFRFRLFALIALLTLCPLLVGCPAQSPSSTGGGSIPGKKIKAGLVTDVGGVGDRSFNAAAWDGMQRAAKELDIEVKYTESKQNGDYVANLSRFADNGYDVVIAVGYLMSDAVKEVSQKYPNVKFAIIDGDEPGTKNAVSYKFREEQGAFLAGALAGAMTKTGTIGFVGGQEMPLIKKFEMGYKAGAMTTNPALTPDKVKVGYAGKFDDPQKGQELALSQMGAGADIIFHAAGQTGTGVIKAVESKGKGKGFYAIGVDKDQDGDAPGFVLTSMVKGVDVAVYDICKAVNNGDFQPGTVVLGLKEKGVFLSPMKYTRQEVPDAVQAKIETLKQRIITGSLTPPSTPEELAKYKPTAP